MLQECGGDCVSPTFFATGQCSNVAEDALLPHSCVLHKVKGQADASGMWSGIISPTLVFSDHLIGAPYNTTRIKPM
jgi:hypothetical protein